MSEKQNFYSKRSLLSLKSSDFKNAINAINERIYINQTILKRKKIDQTDKFIFEKLLVDLREQKDKLVREFRKNEADFYLGIIRETIAELDQPELTARLTKIRETNILPLSEMFPEKR
jgi:hypothetical protein